MSVDENDYAAVMAQRAPRSAPLPRSPEEKLTFAAHHSGVATLGPDQAAALLMRLAALEAIVARARELRDDTPLWPDGQLSADVAVRVARYILGEDG
jgi:hypothetical protein